MLNTKPNTDQTSVCHGPACPAVLVQNQGNLTYLHCVKYVKKSRGFRDFVTTELSGLFL